MWKQSNCSQARLGLLRVLASVACGSGTPTLRFKFLLSFKPAVKLVFWQRGPQALSLRGQAISTTKSPMSQYGEATSTTRGLLSPKWGSEEVCSYRFWQSQYVPGPLGTLLREMDWPSQC